jgi:hypothetical protein
LIFSPKYTIDPISFYTLFWDKTGRLSENEIYFSGEREMKSFFKSLVIIFVCVVVGGAVFVWTGIYNVAADVPHWRGTLLLLEAVRERSIEVHSGGLAVPPLQSEEMINLGFPHFHETCRLCHGAPGQRPQEFAQGMYPGPPALSGHELQRENGDQELYWIVKNGLKMTGMPAFGETHSEKELQGIVAFLRRLPSLDSEAYQNMVLTLSQEGPGEEAP